MPTNAMKTNCKWSHTCHTAMETKNFSISKHNENVDMKLTSLQITILTYSTLSKTDFSVFMRVHKTVARNDYYLQHACVAVWQLSTWKNSASSGQSFLKVYTGDSY